ncbi:MAG: ATP phosphoribosyltransferase regulatory subunit, partial [Firmicutes bacterium]|nr:ATP phosphoribosyltransferase regulatory subunit [Bacillota bacterium]
MGVISAVMDWCGLQERQADDMLEVLRQKNADGMQKLADSAGLDPDQSVLLRTLARVSGDPKAVLEEISRLKQPEAMSRAL